MNIKKTVEIFAGQKFDPFIKHQFFSEKLTKGKK